MPRYIASADVGLCIYEDIDFYTQFYFSPLKLYDYMACGIPVIGTNVGQIRSVIEEQNNGLLTDNTIDDIINKIIFLKNNPALANEMGLRGRKAVLDKYNWENTVLQTESILLEAIKNRNTHFNKYPQYMVMAITNLSSLRFNIARWYHNFLRGMKNNVKKLTVRLPKV